MRTFDDLWLDLRYALRGLRQSPGFACTAILAIAVGIGINAGVFSVVNGFALRDLPAPSAERLVTVHQLFEGVAGRNVRGSRSMFSLREYRAYRDQTRTLTGILAYVRPWTVTLGRDTPQEVEGSLVSCNYFDVLQQRPALGRSFAADACDAPGAAPEIVLGHNLWVNALAADPAIVGQTVVVNRNLFTVVGIAPEGFAGLDVVRASFFVPLSAQPLLRPDVDLLDDAQLSWLTLIGRRETADLEQVRAELAVIAAQIDAQQPGRRTSLVVERATTFSSPDRRPVVLGVAAVVMAAFGLVLLIACANVANLLLARATARTREIALRLSLGATRGRLVQLLLAESMLIAIAGGLLGSLLALWSFQALVAFVISSLPAGAASIRLDPSPDFAVLAYAAGLTFATGIVFGLLPAIQASNPNLYSAIRQEGAIAPGNPRAWSRGALVGAQVAFCLLLTICASLLLRGLYAAQTADPGFDYRDVAVASFDLRGAGYDADEAALFQQALLARTAALPGVTGTAFVVKTPLSPGVRGTNMRLAGQDQLLPVNVNNVTPEYFAVLGIPIVRGRTFEPAEMLATSRAVIVTEATARRLWPGEEPLGKTLEWPISPDATLGLDVVGVAKDVSVTGLGSVDDRYVYFPAVPLVQTDLQLIARTRADLADTIAAIRAAAAELDPGLVTRVGRLEDNLDVWRTLSGLVATLSGALGALALLLASIGVYGLVSYAVSRRLREIGLRVALGAGTRDVLALVLKQNMRPVLIGAAIGVVACVLVARLLTSLLFGVSTLDPLALGGTTLFVLGVALAASLVPACRALRVDPMITLRYE